MWKKAGESKIWIRISEMKDSALERIYHQGYRDRDRGQWRDEGILKDVIRRGEVE